ncbi:cadherin-like domain-containing protein [Desulfobaculum bizertense]|uniref:beta strand repeat-containing protein n=1 Tax=Desulfobaculum bizertense TaxID=376490 RepID=UPI001F1B5543|nr:Ig-like domain-containing protein [Desulfobaculum bizertense]UIJ39320.1 cadherin-like domain-containing protein [Desulfobaculum bizertense]
MADEKRPTTPPSDSEETQRQVADAQSQAQAEQTAEQAEQLRSEEHLTTQATGGLEEQPFGRKKPTETAERDSAAGLGENFGPGLADADGGAGTGEDAVGGGVQNIASATPEDNVGGGVAAVAGADPGAGPEGSAGNALGDFGGFTPVASPAFVGGGDSGPQGTGGPETPQTPGQDELPIAQAPTLNLSTVQGAEDSAISLNILAALQDSDGGAESLTVTIAGVPTGALLSAGTDLGNGVWLLTESELAGLIITPPPNSNEDFVLSITATATESNGSTSSVTTTLPIDVVGVADTPTLATVPITVLEDTPAALDISSALTDTDGSESLSITISGVPSGATLSAGTQNPDGTWSLTPAQLAGLELNPPLHFSGDVTLTVTATATENDGDSTSISTPITATFTAVADAPTLAVQNVSGFEDNLIPLNLSSDLVDQDGSETLSIVIENVPSGAILSAGTDLGGGRWQVDPADLASLQILPPSNFSGNIPLTIIATATEGSNNDTASTTANFNVAVTGVADLPNLATPAAGGDEDTQIPISISSSLVDTDGSETLSINISGVPSGALLSAGTVQADGSYELTPAELAGLTILPPLDFSGTISLTVAATATEQDGDTATRTQTLDVNVNAVADLPFVDAADVLTTEDFTVPLADIFARTTDIDGSESLSLRILQVPAGATFNNGTDNGNGTWTLTPADLQGLTFTGPLHFSGTIDMVVEATATEPNGSTSVNTDPFRVFLNADADIPNVSVQNVTGFEDSPIPLSLSSALVDTDGSETLATVITGVPAGATLSAGTDLGGGRWEVDPADLGSLTITPPLNFSGDINLALESTTTEISNNDTAFNRSPFVVSVTGVADTPTLNTLPTSGSEDSQLPLPISGSLFDVDGSETLSFVISAVPAGATLSAGTLNPDGTWTLTPAELSGLTITPPLHFSGNFDLTVTAIATERDGDVAQTSAPLPVTVTGVPDPPDVGPDEITLGFEDTFIDVPVSAQLTDTDGSETLATFITGVPTGAVLSAGTDLGGGRWQVDPTDLPTLQIQAPQDFSGTINLQLEATSTEIATGISATSTQNIEVQVIPVADPPTLQTTDATGTEDMTVPLSISSALTDIDGSETLSLVISNVPSGFTLNNGTDQGGGVWSLAPGDLAGLTITPPLDFKGSFTLNVAATSTEPNGDTATTPGTLNVTIQGDADTPNISTPPASGLEDNAIPLSITASPSDTSGSESVTGYTISNVPAGATLSAGTDQGGGVWTLTPAEISGLTITPPLNSNVDFNLSVEVTVTEIGGDTSTATSTLPVAVTGVADTPNLAAGNSTGNEDTAIALNVSGSLVDTDGSESLTYNISNIPTGATLSAGTLQPDGSYNLTPAELATVTITPPQDFSGSFVLTATATSTENDGDTASATDNFSITVNAVADAPSVVVSNVQGIEDVSLGLSYTVSETDIDGSESITSIVISGVPNGFSISNGTDLGGGNWSVPPNQSPGTITAPTHFSGQLNLSITATSTEPNGDSATTTTPFTATFVADADTPDIAAANVTGNEDTAIPLSLASSLVDTDGSETLGVVLQGVPLDATLNVGTNMGGGEWAIPVADLGNVTLTPGLHFSGDIPLTLVATATESSNNDNASASASFNVHVVGVADTPGLTASLTNVDEDTDMPVNVTGTLVDTDGSESLSYEISGVPNGFTLSAGTDQGGGVYTLTPSQLAGLTLTPPTNFSGSVSLNVTVTSTETDGDTASTSTTISGSFGPVADPPATTVQNTTGNEDTAIPLTLSAALTDTDGSETLATVITGVPAGATLSAGTDLGGGRWSVDPADLGSITITPPLHFSGSISLGLEATSTETANNDMTTVTSPFTVTVVPIPDQPNLATPPATGDEDVPFPLGITSSLVDTDGSEVLGITITGVPNGFTLSAGTDQGGGVWELTPAQLAGLSINAPLDFKGSFNLTVIATATEQANNTSATNISSLPVTINAVADVPDVTAQPATTNEDTDVVLDITAMATDTTGSETITNIIIDGVPAGTTLSAGTQTAPGRWEIDPADVPGLTLSPIPDSNVDFTLTVTAIAEEPNGSTNQNSVALPVDIIGVADTPTINADDATGNEDTFIPVNVSGMLTDVDGSETLSFQISNVPNGATLNVGTNLGGGVWEVDASDIANLRVRPPRNFSGDIQLTATSIATENDGDVATNSDTLTITVDAVADRPRVRARSVNGTEDTDLPLNLFAAVTDPSETIISTQISNVPTGFTIVGGTDLGGGVWSVPPNALNTIEITPRQDFSGTVNLRFTAISEDVNGDTASRGRNFNASFEAVADTPSVTAGDVTGLEDTPIQMNFLAAITDIDLSETLTLKILNVPAGSSFNLGTDNGDGTWSIDPADLPNITFTAPLNFSGDVAMTLEATATEPNGSTAVNTDAFNVHVVGDADTPKLKFTSAMGLEDSAIALTVRAELLDTDGSESLFVEFSNVPAGASFSGGSETSPGVWLIPAAALPTLTFTPPLHSNDDVTLTIRALSVEADGDQAYSPPRTLNIGIKGVPDAPNVTSNASGDEDTSIALNVTVTPEDTDGSETITYIIRGLPSGASINTGTFIGNGRYALTQAELDSAEVTPPEDFSGVFNVTLDTVVQENDGAQATFTNFVPVNVAPVVDEPTRGGIAAARSYGSASGPEDTAISLNLDPLVQDIDGSEQVLYVDVTNVPAGAVLAGGTEISPGVFRFTPADFANATITGPQDFGGTFDLSVSATIQDSGTVTAVATGPLRVNIIPDADPPTITGGDVSGETRTYIPANISSSLTDTDGSETLHIYIDFNGDLDVFPSAGLNLGGGTFLVTEAELANLEFYVYRDNPNRTIPVTVTAIATDSNGDTATSTDTFNIQLTGVGAPGGPDGPGGGGPGGGPGGNNPPTATITPPTGTEDNAFDVDITPDFGNFGAQESIVLSNLPPGATPNIGFFNPLNNTWVIPGDNPALLDTLQITPPQDFAGPLTFDVTVLETSANGQNQSNTYPVTANITPVVDPPRVSLGNRNGDEDTPLNIDLQVNTTDIDGSESITSVVITNLPPGSSLTGVVDLGGGRFEVPLGQLDQVVFNPPPHDNGNFSFTVETVVQESDGSTSTFSNSVSVNIDPLADPALVTVNNANGQEDTAIPLVLDATLTDTDGSELIAITISNVPSNAVFSDGHNNGDGSWTFTEAELSGLTFTAPPNANGDFNMVLNAITREVGNNDTNTTSRNFTVSVEGVADVDIVDSQNTSGDEDTAIPITLSYTEVDTDGSETASVIITGIPAGSSLSAGIEGPSGTWTVAGTDLPSLTITPPTHFSGTINAVAEFVSTENDGDTASVTEAFEIEVNPVADAPDLNPTAAIGNEDGNIPLNVGAALVDPDEVLEVVIDNLPPGATLTAGTQNPDGSWTLTPAELTGLELVPALNQSGTFSLDITATSTEPANNDSATSTASLPLTIIGVADPATVTTTDTSGDEDTTIPITITAALQDTDGSESITSVVISNVPAGSTLSAGTEGPSGTWTLSEADLSGLTVTPPTNFAGDMNLNVAVTTTETDGDTNVTNDTVTVAVAGVADPVTIVTTDTNGNEDSAIPLSISATLQDTDGSESITSVVVSNVPAGSALSAGTEGPAGTWTLAEGDLAGLTVTPPLNYSGTMNLSVAVTTTDTGGDTNTTNDSVSVAVKGVADPVTPILSDATGSEDTAIPLNIGFALQDTDGSETLSSVVITNLPPGSTLSAGTEFPPGLWTLAEADLPGLTVTPPTNYSGTVTVTVEYNNAEQDFDTNFNQATFQLTVVPGADAPLLTTNSVSGDEDTPIALDIQVALTDPSETLGDVVISGVPTGATLSAGTESSPGVWEVDPGDLAGLSITPPQDYSGSFNLFVEASSNDGGSSSSTTGGFFVTVEGQPDAPDFVAPDSSGEQDTPIDLNITAQTTAPDETLTLNVDNIPSGATLSAGTLQPDGSWDVDEADVSGLQINPPSGFTGSFDLDLTVTVSQDGNDLVQTDSVTVDVQAPAPAPAPFAFSFAASPYASMMSDASDESDADSGGSDSTAPYESSMTDTEPQEQSDPTMSTADPSDPATFGDMGQLLDGDTETGTSDGDGGDDGLDDPGSQPGDQELPEPSPEMQDEDPADVQVSTDYDNN